MKMKRTFSISPNSKRKFTSAAKQIQSLMKNKTFKLKYTKKCQYDGVKKKREDLFLSYVRRYLLLNLDQLIAANQTKKTPSAK